MEGQNFKISPCVRRLCLAQMSSLESDGIVSRPSLNFEPTFDQELLSRTGAFGPSHSTPCRLRRKGAQIYTLRMGGKAVALGRPIVTVMQSAQAIMGKHLPRGYAASSAPRRSLSKSKMRAVLVMVGDVLGKQALHMPLVESNHMVEQLATAASHPAVGNTILPGTFEGGPHGVYLQGSNGCRDLRPIFCIPVMD